MQALERGRKEANHARTHAAKRGGRSTLSPRTSRARVPSSFPFLAPTTHVIAVFASLASFSRNCRAQVASANCEIQVKVHRDVQNKLSTRCQKLIKIQTLSFGSLSKCSSVVVFFSLKLKKKKNLFTSLTLPCKLRRIVKIWKVVARWSTSLPTPR